MSNKVFDAIHNQTLPLSKPMHAEMPARTWKSSVPVWNSLSLKDTVNGYSTPLVVRAAPAGRQQNGDATDRLVYVHSVAPRTVAVAEGLRRDGKSRLTPTGRRYVIPVDHRGWFELLSQDGHSAAPLTTVAQLIQAAPERCLVRRSLVALKADDSRRQCSIVAGETLTLDSAATAAAAAAGGGTGTMGRRCLRCRVDRTGDIILLSPDQRGLFSPIAGPTNVVGVHRMRSIVGKFRFPVVVRLIASSPTTSAHDDAGRSADFAFRVVDARVEEAAYVVPLWIVRSPSDVVRKSLLSVSISSQASVVLEDVPPSPSANHGDAALLWESSDSRWVELRRRCDDLIASHNVSAEITRLTPDAGSQPPQRRSQSNATSGNRSLSAMSPRASSSGDESRLLREIDDIYAAIKTGSLSSRLNSAGKSPAIVQNAPRFYRSVRSNDKRQKKTAQPANGIITDSRPSRSPPRRSNTLDPASVKPQVICRPGCSPPPNRIRRMTSYVAPPQQRTELRPHNENLYEDLRVTVKPTTPQNSSSEKSAEHVSSSAGGRPESTAAAHTNSHVSATSNAASPHAANNLRQVLKQSTSNQSGSSSGGSGGGASETGAVAAGRSARPMSFAGTASSAWTLELADSRLSAAAVDDDVPPPLPAKRGQRNGFVIDRSDGAVIAGDNRLQAAAVNGAPPARDGNALTPPSCEDVITPDRKSTSAFGAVSNSFMRVLRRAGSRPQRAQSTVADVGHERSGNGNGVERQSSCWTDNRAPSCRLESQLTASQLTTGITPRDGIAVECGGSAAAKVTHF